MPFLLERKSLAKIAKVAENLKSIFNFALLAFLARNLSLVNFCN